MENNTPKNSGIKSRDEITEILYKKWDKVYPRQVHGLFARLRTSGVLLLLGLYYLVPWFSWDNRQAVLFDLPARKFYIFGLTFWPQDFIYLAFLLIIAAVALFFFTTLAGRLWCGYACPQTAWTEVFLWMERYIEGDRSKQMKLDNSSMSPKKFYIKTKKHTVWILFSLFTGFVFVGYFTPIYELWDRSWALQLGGWEIFWIFFYGLATYGNAGWLREQVCIYMCPYARFQSAMFDANTLVISYDENRGEPRGSRKRNTDPKAKSLGDCISCTLCVQVCPTGIDIREGIQYQCIGCAACIDVCDDVMDKMGYEKGLIRYTTENAIHGKESKILRPRIFIYASILISLTIGLIYAISQRVPLELDIIRDRNTLYRETDEGLVENVYTLKMINMDETRHEYNLSAMGIEGMEIVREAKEIVIEPGEVISLTLEIRVDPVNLKRRSTGVHFTLQSKDRPDIKTTHIGKFIGPVIK